MTSRPLTPLEVSSFRAEIQQSYRELGRALDELEESKRLGSDANTQSSQANRSFVNAVPRRHGLSRCLGAPPCSEGTGEAH